MSLMREDLTPTIGIRWGEAVMVRPRRSVDRQNLRAEALEDGDATISLPPWAEALVGGAAASGSHPRVKELFDGHDHRPTPEHAERGTTGATRTLAWTSARGVEG